MRERLRKTIPKKSKIYLYNIQIRYYLIAELSFKIPVVIDQQRFQNSFFYVTFLSSFFSPLFWSGWCVAQDSTCNPFSFSCLYCRNNDCATIDDIGAGEGMGGDTIGSLGSALQDRIRSSTKNAIETNSLLPL